MLSDIKYKDDDNWLTTWLKLLLQPF